MEQNPYLKKYAQKNRKNQTKEEARLWHQFLSRYPCRFRRQYVIGNYIADFYCHQAKLVIELDGSQHCETGALEKDRERDSYLESLGMRVLRFSNLDIQRHFQEVCAAVDQAVKERTGCKL